MFDGMDLFDADPYSIKEMPSGQANLGTPTDPIQAASEIADATKDIADAVASAPSTSAGVATGVSSVARAVGGGFEAKYQAKLQSQAQQLQALREQGKVSEAAYAKKMADLAKKSQPGFMNRYGTLVIIGAIVLVGGIGWYVWKRR